MGKNQLKFRFNHGRFFDGSMFARKVNHTVRSPTSPITLHH